MTGLTRPHDLDAERAVLAAMLARPEAIDQALAHLRPDDWFSVRHQSLFVAIVKVDQEGAGVDVVSVLQAMRDSGAADAETSGQLAELTYEALVADVDKQARRLAALGRARALLLGLERLVASGYHAHDSDQWVETVERTVADLTDREQRAEQQVLPEQLHDVLETLAEREKPDGKRGYWPTDLSALNRLLYGWIPSLLYIIAATPGIGKTSFALQQACHLAGTQVGDETLAVVFFSMEMPRGELVERMLSQAALVPNEAMKLGQLKPYWAELTNAAAILGNKPILVDDTPALSVLEVRSRSRRAMAKLRKKFPGKNLRLAMVVCDHLQLMQGVGETRDQQIGSVTKGLMKFAKDTACAVVCLSQLNRTQQKEKQRPPMLSDLRDSGNIESDANTVFFLHSADAQRSAERSPEILGILAKNRGGRTGTVPLHFRGECTLFMVPEHAPELDSAYGFDNMGPDF